MSVTSNIIPICRLNEILNRKLIKETLFVVSDVFKKEEALIYADDNFNNSDRVRSHFAKRTGIKFNDVRCCRLKNYKD